MTPTAWADLIVSRIPEEVTEALAADPAQAMRDHFELSVRASNTLGHRGEGGWCDGLSFRRHREVLYAPSPYSKRMYFTLLHEVGHKLTDDEEDPEVLDWLGELPDERRVVEQVCDLVAGRLLVPEAAAVEALQGERPTGAALARLHEITNASREACAVALAPRIGCPGFVTVIRDERITFTARLADPQSAPWRDVPLPTGHPLRSLADGSSQQLESWWPDSTGRRRRYYQHAYRNGPWTYAVFAQNDLWSVAKLHLPVDEERPRSSADRIDFKCTNCGLACRTRTFKCNRCGGPACPECEHCRVCDQKELLPRAACKHCFASVLPHLLDSQGFCPDCQIAVPVGDAAAALATGSPGGLR